MDWTLPLNFKLAPILCWLLSATNNVLRDMTGRFVFVYLDHILEAENAFQKLERCFTSAPVLTQVDPEIHFILKAFDIEVGAELFFKRFTPVPVILTEE